MQRHENQFQKPWEELSKYFQLWMAHFTGTVRSEDGEVLRTATDEELKEYVMQMKVIADSSRIDELGE